MTTEHYVDKKKLYDDLCDWKILRDKAIEEDRQPPALPESVGRAILDIVEGTGRRPNFRNYTYLEEMKGDATIQAVRAMNKFDPNRLGAMVRSIHSDSLVVQSGEHSSTESLSRRVGTLVR